MRKLPLVLSAGVVVRKLSATVVVARNQKPGKARQVSHVGIWWGRGTGKGGRYLGEITLPGVWTEAQALAEFRKAPHRWGQKDVPEVSSDIDILLAGSVVARFYNAVGAEYTPETALAFFKEKGHLFERGPAYDLAVQCNLAAA
jgi:hypothetical protein